MIKRRPGLSPHSPLVVFSVSPEPGKTGPYFAVEIFASNWELQAYEHAEVKRRGPFWALADCLTGFEWGRRSLKDIISIGRILFSRDYLTHGLIAHEVQHAALHYGHWAGLRYRRLECSKRDWMAPVGRTSVTEERLAEITENLTKEIYAGLKAHHEKVQ